MYKVTYTIINNYVTELIEDLESYYEVFHFRTDMYDMSINELLEDDIKSSSFYFNICAPNGNAVFIDLDIPKYYENTDFTEYIDNLLKLIEENIITNCEYFDAEKKFKNLRKYYSHCAPGLVLATLTEDEKFFRNFAKNVKTYKYKKIHNESGTF